MAPPNLPTELWLEIFRYAEARDLWLSMRAVDKRLKTCAEDMIQKKLADFTISLSFSPGSASHHRGIALSFSSISKYNAQYALFDKITYLPTSSQQRAWEKWNQICSAGIGSDLDWRVQLERGAVRKVRMPNLIISCDHGAWCDWKEMLDAYFAEPGALSRTPLCQWHAV